jgi:beta-glucanase (GH16 family)
MLNIVAHKEDYENCHYTSGKLTTFQKKTIRFGRIDVVAKIPQGAGTWPAIWLLGENKSRVGWPLCGEIDLMEHIGREPQNLHFSLHSQAFNHRLNNHRTKVVIHENLWEAFHEFSLEWDPDSISFFVDGILQAAFVKHEKDTVSQWPFQQGFYLIINFALGGTWGGVIDDAIFPVVFQIKSVKVYEPDGEE